MSTSNGDTRATLLRNVRDLRNEAAWADFLRRYQPLIDRWCRACGLPHHDAEEVTGRVLAKLATAMSRYVYDPERGRFRSWLKTVVQREVTDFWRSLGRTPGRRGSGSPRLQSLLEQQLDPASIEDLTEELHDGLQRHLAECARIRERVRARVLPTTWEAYWRFAILGHSAKQVAEQLGMRTSAVFQAKYSVGKKLVEEAKKQA